MNSKGYPRLLGDVGGTNARLAWQAAPEAELEHVTVLPARDHPSLEAAIRHFLRERGLPPPVEAAIGMANPVEGDEVRMTNHHWSFSINGMRDALGLQRLAVVNDFTALALALPTLGSQDLRQLGGGTASPTAPRALIGAGTGLGVSGLLPAGPGRWVPLAGEGGHVTLAATTPREASVVAWLQARFGHASAERAVSGQGLENLYQALSALDGVVAPALAAAEISQRGLSPSPDRRCAEALALFCAFLGTVAGNLALTLGAGGGVYLGGGIVPRLGSFLGQSEFRARFEAKGRFSDWLRKVPVFVIQSEISPALRGAAQALDSGHQPS